MYRYDWNRSQQNPLKNPGQVQCCGKWQKLKANDALKWLSINLQARSYKLRTVVVFVCWGGERRQPDDVDDNPSAAAVQLATPWSTHSRAAMAGDMSIGCAALKRSTKLKSCTSAADTDSMHHMPNDRKENGNNTGLLMKPPCAPQNMRGGLRVYKIVILGDGGVGKSGKLAAAPSVFLLSVFILFSVLFLLYHCAFWLCLRKINKLSQFLLRFVLRPPNHPQSSGLCFVRSANFACTQTKTHTHTHTRIPMHTRTGTRVLTHTHTPTAVTLQFVSHSFLDYHDPTIGEFDCFDCHRCAHLWPFCNPSLFLLLLFVSQRTRTSNRR